MLITQPAPLVFPDPVVIVPDPPIIMPRGPGSNGYYRRESYLRAGAFTWTAPKTGRIKIYNLGAGGGAGYYIPGASGGLAAWEGDVTEGDVLTLTVGAGGLGKVGATNGEDGGTTSVVCAAAGINLLCAGASGGRSLTSGMVAGTATGGNLFNYAGAIPASTTSYRGGCASASPFGPGQASNAYSLGGIGWGGPIDALLGRYAYGGGSSHFPQNAYNIGANGLITRGGGDHTGGTTTNPISTIHGESAEWWDLSDADGAGGGEGPHGGHGGFAAGGGASEDNAGVGGNGGFGAGGGAAQGSSSIGGHAGNGGGGGAGNDTGGRGGPGAILIYWQEVVL